MAGQLKRATVTVLNLGRMPFQEAWSIQYGLFRRHLDFLAGTAPTPGQNTLILVEHPPVYTVGYRTDENISLEEEEKLKSLGAEFYKIRRGGLITFHGPGQLVAYPILNLADFKKSARWYVCALEKSLVRTCEKFGVLASTTSDVGVWVNQNKIAAIGINMRRFVTSHGVSLNCDVDLGWFSHITPCGIADKEKGVTTLSNEACRNIGITDAAEKFVESFSELFNCDVTFADSKETKS